MNVLVVGARLVGDEDAWVRAHSRAERGAKPVERAGLQRKRLPVPVDAPEDDNRAGLGCCRLGGGHAPSMR